jgi:hypothetical protein
LEFYSSDIFLPETPIDKSWGTILNTEHRINVQPIVFGYMMGCDALGPQQLLILLLGVSMIMAGGAGLLGTF